MSGAITLIGGFCIWVAIILGVRKFTRKTECSRGKWLLFYRVALLSMFGGIVSFVFYALAIKIFGLEPQIADIGGRLILTGLILLPILAWAAYKKNWRKVWYCDDKA
jgi:hypothetical protein